MLPITIGKWGEDMKISNEQVRKVLQGYVRQVENRKAEKAKSSESKVEGAAAKVDSVTITTRSQEVVKAKEVYEKLPDTRSDLVDELKSKIEAGKYNVASKDVAEKIIHRAVVDKTV